MVVILMMRLIYSISCGLDVHKNIIVATIVSTSKDGISEYKQKSVSAFNSDIQKFYYCLIENECKNVCMESTSKYWIPFFNYFEGDIDVYLTKPKYIKDKKIPNRLLTSISLILSDVLLFHHKISISFVNRLVIV